MKRYNVLTPEAGWIALEAKEIELSRGSLVLRDDKGAVYAAFAPGGWQHFTEADEEDE